MPDEKPRRAELVNTKSRMKALELLPPPWSDLQTLVLMKRCQLSSESTTWPGPARENPFFLHGIAGSQMSSKDKCTTYSVVAVQPDKAGKPKQVSR